VPYTLLGVSHVTILPKLEIGGSHSSNTGPVVVARLPITESRQGNHAVTKFVKEPRFVPLADGGSKFPITALVRT
jgi:hypothetical protein